jgi:hypothetical protein
VSSLGSRAAQWRKRYDLSFTYRINKKKNERDKMRPKVEKKKADFNKKRTYEMGPFFISSGSISIKKRTCKTVLFLCVNQTKLIALSLLFFSLMASQVAPPTQ